MFSKTQLEVPISLGRGEPTEEDRELRSPIVGQMLEVDAAVADLLEQGAQVAGLHPDTQRELRTQPLERLWCLEFGPARETQHRIFERVNRNVVAAGIQ